VHVYGGVPVVAAIERGMEAAMVEGVRGTCEQMIQLVRVGTRDIRERDARKDCPQGLAEHPADDAPTR
jgi:hypothetical protein